jgi:phage tail-like protein
VAVARRVDPYRGYGFLVEFEGLIVGGFAEVTGLTLEIEGEPFREGGVNGYMQRLAGPVRYPSNLVLRRGITDSHALWSWQADVAAGKVTRRNGSIILLDDAGNEAWRWNVREALPVRWVGPDLRASQGTVAIEALELTHRGLTTDSTTWQLVVQALGR